jgi:UDP-N-acetylglucosamine 2-epimerase (non-hydrolysing)
LKSPRVLGVVGARPNFIKMAPVVAALRKRGITTRLVHTGQHFDRNMSQIFFEQLGLPEPDTHLGAGGLTPWAQSAAIIDRLGELLSVERPEWVVVPGDVNSTLAAAVAAVRAGRRLAHLEAGLRSFDRTMPEELNRIVTDHLAELLFVTEPAGERNLLSEAVSSERIRFVGNTMIDTLLASRDLARRSELPMRLGLSPGTNFTLVTMHRPATVDHRAPLAELCAILGHALEAGPVVFPVHPRTRARLAEFGLLGGLRALPGLHLLDPVGYLDFLALLERARVVLTDSGGIQEETTALGVGCLTLRPNTERPITCEVGTNRVVGIAAGAVCAAFDDAWQTPPAGRVPEGWDGKASERVADVFVELATAS